MSCFYSLLNVYDYTNDSTDFSCTRTSKSTYRNAYIDHMHIRLLVQSCYQLLIDKKVDFIYDEKRLYASMSSNTNVMDTWIVS
ncbi:unnamed protein product [Rotaria sp. Silwood2]|nr:unnamed protein product [Rotaria sp. Silwood2]CAF3613748.1 unnamed protein product [Rotaria sp. Silwood2]CAF4425241.1 unnamed protein product [Rotaria sp. Silwood2]CAF4892158.1 unnamed protein product [Rotaria sp. Silwood2]